MVTWLKGHMDQGQIRVLNKIKWAHNNIKLHKLNLLQALGLVGKNILPIVGEVIQVILFSGSDEQDVRNHLYRYGGC